MAEHDARTVRHDPYAALRYPNFARYVVVLFSMTLAIQIQGTVVGWQVYDLTKGPFALGMIGLAEALPAIRKKRAIPISPMRAPIRWPISSSWICTRTSCGTIRGS